MAELREALDGAGYAEVKTYIQSGNVVLSAPSVRPADITQILVEQFDLNVPVVVRSGKQLANVIKNNPFPEAEENPKHLLVYFCDGKPTEAAVEAFDIERFEPDRFGISGANVYVAYDANIARSKLTNVTIDRNLKVVSTARNWSTVLRLHEMVNQT